MDRDHCAELRRHLGEACEGLGQGSRERWQREFLSRTQKLPQQHPQTSEEGFSEKQGRGRNTIPDPEVKRLTLQTSQPLFVADRCSFRVSNYTYRGNFIDVGSYPCSKATEVGQNQCWQWTDVLFRGDGKHHSALSIQNSKTEASSSQEQHEKCLLMLFTFFKDESTLLKVYLQK